MDNERSPNPARNPARSRGSSKYSKEFLLLFRDVHINPPAELNNNLRGAGVTSPVSPVTPPPPSPVPSINVTSAKGKIFANPDGEAKKKEAVKLLQVRTHAKLLAKEGALKQKQEDLDSQRAEFEQEKRGFYEKRAELYCNFNILQEGLARKFRNLDQRFNEFEEAKLKSAIDVLNKLIATENEKTSHAELPAKIKMTKEQLEETNGRLTAVAKRLLDFFHTKEDIPKDLQAAVTRCEVEYRALMEEQQQQHDATTNCSAHDTGCQEVSSYFSTGRLDVTTGGKDDLVIITGIPADLSVQDIIQAVDKISGHTIQVEATVPGTPYVTALGRLHEHPDKFFEGNFHVLKNSKLEPMGSASLHFVSGDL